MLQSLSGHPVNVVGADIPSVVFDLDPDVDLGHDDLLVLSVKVYAWIRVSPSGDPSLFMCAYLAACGLLRLLGREPQVSAFHNCVICLVQWYAKAVESC